MPRQARVKSKTGIYHVMLKGIDDRDIFLDDDDRSKFLEQLLKSKEKGDFSLLAYCLMDNHVHLLIEENEEIGKSIKRMAVGYVLWHNYKYGRKGHLFQNRFNSEAVETESYFLTVVRYIHQNPVKAGIVHFPGDYYWSSYQQYLADYHCGTCYIDVKRVKDYYKRKKGSKSL
jgi:REP element-mobilizing transposase RayT